MSGMARVCLSLQPTQWVLFSSPWILLLLGVIAGLLALLDDRAFVVVHLFSKSWFGAFLYCRARMLYYSMKRSLGVMGFVNVMSVLVMLGVSTALLAEHDYRKLVFVGGGAKRTSASFWDVPFGSAEARQYVDGHGLRLRSMVASAGLVHGPRGLVAKATSARMLYPVVLVLAL